MENFVLFVFGERGGGGGARVFGGFLFDAVVLAAAARLRAVTGGVGGTRSWADDGGREIVWVFVNVGFAAVGVRAEGGCFHEQAAGGRLVARGIVTVGVGRTARLGCCAGCA